MKDTSNKSDTSIIAPEKFALDAAKELKDATSCASVLLHVLMNNHHNKELVEVLHSAMIASDVWRREYNKGLFTSFKLGIFQTTKDNTMTNQICTDEPEFSTEELTTNKSIQSSTTLRDSLAIKTMTALLATGTANAIISHQSGMLWTDAIANDSYAMADAMLRARQQPTN